MIKNINHLKQIERYKIFVVVVTCELKNGVLVSRLKFELRIANYNVSSNSVNVG